MSGHLRFGFAAFVLLAGLSTSSAYSNPIADMFPAFSNPFAGVFSAAPRETPAPAPAEEECLSRPGKSTADGQRWVYRLDGRRKCWYQTAEEAAVKKPVRHRVAKSRVANPEENEAAPRKRRAVVDARAELLRSAPAESQPTRPAPELKVVDAASVLATATAAYVPPASTEDRATDQPAPDRRTPHQVDVERLLAAAPATSNPVAASVPPAAPVALPAEASDDEPSWMATWLGVVLMALGLIAVLGSTRTLREAVLLRG